MKNQILKEAKTKGGGPSCVQFIDDVNAFLGSPAGKTVFIATNDIEGVRREMAGSSFAEKNQIYFFEDIPAEACNTQCTPLDFLVIEQIICIDAREFVGNHFSSVSRGIAEKRAQNTGFFPG
eukprot:GHVN01019678.1.p1 GENE.GHVN01019678.1~~GHVN01019678.1.p1  ORF type:complete len:122 (-),score=14.59 GHVN01019678.1:721-1086(-)